MKEILEHTLTKEIFTTSPTIGVTYVKEGNEMGKYISLFFTMIVLSIGLFYLVVFLMGGGEGATLSDIITIVISIQCSVIITLLIAVLEQLRKNKK
jgi:hypothetical protein